MHLTTHNHASLKYSNHTVDAWVTRWDNVGFDGPVVNPAAEFEVADALVSDNGMTGIGYIVSDAALPPTRVTIPAVDVKGATRARLSFGMLWLQNQFGDANFDTYSVRYRLNGGAWHSEFLSAAERALLANGVVLAGDLAGRPNALKWGSLGQIIDLSVGELVQGTNSLDLGVVVTATGISQPFALRTTATGTSVGRFNHGVLTATGGVVSSFGAEVNGASNTVHFAHSQLNGFAAGTGTLKCVDVDDGYDTARNATCN